MRLNLGCGDQRPDGWVNVDKTDLDLTADPWPWGAGSADGIVIHHVLDLLTHAEMAVVLRNCYETLKLGAVLRMSGADLDRGVRAALDADWTFFAEPKATPEETVGFFITQASARRQWLTMGVIEPACWAVGFRRAFPTTAHETIGADWMTDLDSREGESWFCECVR